MQIRSSESETREVTLRDLDVDLGGPTPKELTLRPEDELHFEDSGNITVRFAKTGEQVTMRAAHIRWHSLRERTVQEKVERP